MGAIIGNTGPLFGETGFATAKAIEALEQTVLALKNKSDRTISGQQSMIRHSSLQALDFASSGHTGFASSTTVTAHTGSTSNPHSTTLQQVITANAAAAAEPTFNGGIDLGTSGRIDSNVVDGAGAYNVLIKPTTTLTPGQDRYLLGLQKSNGDVVGQIAADGTVGIGGAIASGNVVTFGGGVSFGADIDVVMGANATLIGATNISGYASTVVSGALFLVSDGATGTSNDVVGGAFLANTISARVHTGIYGALFRGGQTFGVAAHGTIAGWRVLAIGAGKNSSATLVCGGYIGDTMSAATPAATTQAGLWIDEQTRGTAKYGIWLGNATAGYKAIAIRDANTWIGSSAAATLDLNATTVKCVANLDVSAKNVVTDTTTGTQFGTAAAQKLSLWGVATVVQPSSTGQTAGHTAGAGTAVDDASTFTGGTGSTAYTIGDLVKHLKAIGAIAV